MSALIAVAVAAPSGLELLGSPLGLSSGLSAGPWGNQWGAPLGLSHGHQGIITKQIISEQPIVQSIVQPQVTGQIVQHVPTAVSHQSQSQVHHSNIVTPVISNVQKQIISSVPVVNTIAAPLAVSHGWNAHAAPLAVSHGWNAHAAPLALSHGWNGAALSSHGWNGQGLW